ncbi:MAG: T9SS type A sorting domain-containing protein, partial [Candidatus Competibacteraceae bacterium]|nr:T9SS type A sorting domain-containing protein [Candidatus Competibacteraceae bacterium]
DNCAGALTGTTTDPLSYTSQGTYTVTWTYDDGFGNTITQTQQVVVDDNTAPTPNVSMLPDIEGCNVIITTTPMATDDCDGNIIATTSDPLSYSTPGTYTVNWLFEDVSGNTTSQVQTVSVFDCSGIDEQAGIMQIVLFPNPTEGMITLQFSEMPEGDCHLRLINTLGQVIQVMMIQGPVVEMDLTMLPAATYYIQIVTQNGIKVEPIIVK